jgi:hypothetical protein
MTNSESQGSVEIACDHCEHLYISNLGVTVLADVESSPEGGEGPYLHFCSPQCEVEWRAKHGQN